LILCSLEPPYPVPVLVSFFEALTLDDMILLRAIVHYGVVPVNEGVAFIDALLDIFAFAGKIEQFLIALIGLEFSKDELQINTVLRANTHVTNLFKAFFARYAKPYFDSCLSKIIDYILGVGNIGLSHIESADKEKAEVMLFTVLKYILHSENVIPAEIRYLASILKAEAIVRFNNKQATYNTLVGFICLRFITAVIADPIMFRPNTEEFSPEMMTMLMPFSQLLQTPINLAPFDERFEKFSDWNPRVRKHIWPKLIKFVLSVADLKEKLFYQPPSEEQVFKSLSRVLTSSSAKFQQFKNQYEFLQRDPNVFHPIGWNLAGFLSAFFQGNV